MMPLSRSPISIIDGQSGTNTSKEQKMNSSNELGLKNAVDPGLRATIDGFVSDYASVLIAELERAGDEAATRERSH
jgi:hypothetical protein